MDKIYSIFIFFLTACLSPSLFSASLEYDALPEVAQGADVHSLSKTYCKALWSRVRAGEYLAAEVSEFKETFAGSVLELGTIIEKIKNEEPVLIGAQLNLIDKPITDPAMLAVASYFDRDAYAPLQTAVTSISVLGKHKGGADLDTETNAHVNEVFVYVWGKVKEDPERRLPAFLLGLVDASSTCIQGYAVRMLCAVHPPKLKGVVKK